MPLSLVFFGILSAILMWEAEKQVSTGQKISILSILTLKNARRRPAFVFGLIAGLALAGCESWLVWEGSLKPKEFWTPWLGSIAIVLALSALLYIKHSNVFGPPSKRKGKIIGRVSGFIVLLVLILNKIF